MKSQLYLSALFIFSFCFISEQLLANHAAGGRLTYSHLIGNQYMIHADFYRDCSGDPVPATFTVQISSVQCGITDSVVLNPVPGTGQELASPCASQTTCVGGTEPGFQKWSFENTFTFSGQCSDWIMSINFGTRSAGITTIQNPSAENLYLEAHLNNQLGDNTSIQFSVDPIYYACIGQSSVYNPGAVDADGDSLVFELIPARTDVNTNVTYNVSYSALQPISSSPSVTLDPATGDLVMSPQSQEMGIAVYRILEYRNSVLIGSVTSEMNIYTIPCLNTLPGVSGINGFMDYSYVVAPGLFCFDFYSYDADANDTVSMTINNSGIPGSTFYTTGTTHPTAHFCWDPDSSDVRPQPYTLTVTVTDNSCPIQGAQVFSFTITVIGYSPGMVFFDQNQDGIKDSLEVGLPNQEIYVTPDNVIFFSNSSGRYFFYSLVSGNQTVALIPHPGWHITTDSLSYTFPDSSTNANLDFGIAPDSMFNALDVHLTSGNPTCNSVEHYYLSYSNEGASAADGKVILILDDTVTFVNSTPAPDLISGDTLIYYFANLFPFQQQQIFVDIGLPGPGTNLLYNSLIQIDSSGNYLTLNSEILQQVVTCSFDPNDKAVSPEGLYSDHRTLYNDTLLYTIRFQNTGNDTAFTVFVLDTLDPSLDINSFHVVGSSHAMNTTVYPDRSVEFRFENILLPDSDVDEPGSNGFIQYEIVPLSNLSLPVVVENIASIFFDSNAPVVTNTVWNTLVSDLTVGTIPVDGTDESISVVPNPFNNEARLILSKSFSGVETSFAMMDAMGRRIENKTVSASEILITKGNLSPGIYFFELKNQKGNRATGKIMIE